MQPRQPNMKGLLWADATCINQHDDKEKSENISMTSSIYSEAEKVLVWVGVAADDSDELFNFLYNPFCFRIV
jgi:hypothetical protein